MYSQHVKTAQQDFWHIVWLFWKKISSKNSVLVVSEILGLFVNRFSPDDKNSSSAKAGVSRKQLRYNYLQTKRYFLSFFLHFRSLHSNLEYFEKKDEPQGLLFSKIIGCKKTTYLNAWKALSMTTYWQSTY